MHVIIQLLHIYLAHDAQELNAKIAQIQQHVCNFSTRQVQVPAYVSCAKAGDT